MGGTPSTNSIESLNYQLRKVTKNRGHFPSDEAVIKLLWLAICDIEDKRARERDKEKGLPASKRRAKGKLVEGQITTDWNKALAQLTTAYPDRFAPYLNRLHRNLDRLLGLLGVFRTVLVFLLQATFFRPKNSLSTSSGVRYPRAE